MELLFVGMPRNSAPVESKENKPLLEGNINSVIILSHRFYICFAAAEEEPTPLNKKIFFAIFLLTFADQFSTTVFYPFLPDMLAYYFPGDDGTKV
jgi:hypothetical protein